MNALYIAASIPIFFLLIGIEFWVNHKRGARTLRLNDTLTNLSCGMGSLISDACSKGFVLTLYTWFFTQFAPWDLSGNPLFMWTLAIIGIDFFYYWFHRHGHRINLFWAGHMVHHQSEEYNLAVALRQSWYVPFFVWIYYLPLILVGVPPIVVFAARTLNTLYQFWIHTETIDRLGPLELILNTPSHHRVHHGINPIYVDKNYAGMFIIWDKIFGTFVPESEEVVYGLVKPLKSWNPWWANVHRFVELVEISKRTRRWQDKVGVWFAGPEWLPKDLGGIKTPPPITRHSQDKYDAQASGDGVRIYIVSNYLLVSSLVMLLLLYEEQMSIPSLCLIGAFILLGLLGWGALFERKTWVLGVELAKWISGVGATVSLVGQFALSATLIWLTALVGLFSLLWLWRYQRLHLAL